MMFNYVVYKITFPNGKIYVGSDTQRGGHNINYFGSWDNEQVENDFSKEQLCNFFITKTILFESKNIEEVRRMEGMFIKLLNSNSSDIGYNRTHRCRK